MVMFKKIKSFEVVFNDPEKVYGSGEKVAGRVIVEVCEVTRVKAVRILACGVAKVLWMQGSQQCKQTSEYLRYEDTLLPEDQPTGENEMVIMRPGNKYEYKFGFELPQGPLGTSFKGKYGCVDYWVKAFLDRPSQPTQETKKNFEVVDLVDVNTPDLMAPVSAKRKRKFPACSFLMGGCLSLLELTEKDSVKVMRFPSMLTLRIRVPELWSPKLPLWPATLILPMARPRC